MISASIPSSSWTWPTRSRRTPAIRSPIPSPGWPTRSPCTPESSGRCSRIVLARNSSSTWPHSCTPPRRRAKRIRSPRSRRTSPATPDSIDATSNRSSSTISTRPAWCSPVRAISATRISGNSGLHFRKRSPSRDSTPGTSASRRPRISATWISRCSVRNCLPAWCSPPARTADRTPAPSRHRWWARSVPMNPRTPDSAPKDASAAVPVSNMPATGNSSRPGDG